MTRTPIIVKRAPIILKSDTVFQTIAAHNASYENAYVMGEYPTIEIARYNYSDDMDKARVHGYKHFAIRPIKRQEEK